jgi:hypothetical protein
MQLRALSEQGLLVVCRPTEPTPVAFLNVYSAGDVWLKVRGCEDCPEVRKCCGSCGLVTDKGCLIQLQTPYGVQKPFHCCVSPTPNDCTSFCQQEFICIEGPQRGRRRRVRDPSGTVIDG